MNDFDAVEAGVVGAAGATEDHQQAVGGDRCTMAGTGGLQVAEAPPGVGGGSKSVER